MLMILIMSEIPLDILIENFPFDFVKKKIFHNFISLFGLWRDLKTLCPKKVEFLNFFLYWDLEYLYMKFKYFSNYIETDIIR